MATRRCLQFVLAICDHQLYCEHDLDLVLALYNEWYVPLRFPFSQTLVYAKCDLTFYKKLQLTTFVMLEGNQHSLLKTSLCII